MLEYIPLTFRLVVFCVSIPMIATIGTDSSVDWTEKTAVHEEGTTNAIPHVCGHGMLTDHTRFNWMCASTFAFISDRR